MIIFRVNDVSKLPKTQIVSSGRENVKAASQKERAGIQFFCKLYLGHLPAVLSSLMMLFKLSPLPSKSSSSSESSLEELGGRSKPFSLSLLSATPMRQHGINEYTVLMYNIENWHAYEWL